MALTARLLVFFFFKLTVLNDSCSQLLKCWLGFSAGIRVSPLSAQTSSRGADCQQIYMEIRVLLADKCDEPGQFTYYCSVCFRAPNPEGNGSKCSAGKWELTDTLHWRVQNINRFLVLCVRCLAFRVRRLIKLQSNRNVFRKFFTNCRSSINQTSGCVYWD